MEEMRKRLVAGMKHGSTLVVMMGDAAPCLLSKFSHSKYFPTREIFEIDKIRLQKHWSLVVRDEDMRVPGASENVRWFDVHKEFNVAVTFQLSESFYGKAIQHCLPWEFCNIVEILHDEVGKKEKNSGFQVDDLDNGLPDFCSIYS
mmetsp:Transcript_9752/g.15730  ORF Transcript_9752/g.15730 Transcript_9752/m.15730 type:complete len:146 (-) Transcript_9752:217-654(-)